MRVPFTSIKTRFDCLSRSLFTIISNVTAGSGGIQETVKHFVAANPSTCGHCAQSKSAFVEFVVALACCGIGEFGGAPLNGQYFARHWGNGSVAALFSYLHTKMPPDRPGRLSPQTYADLTAFLLSRNGYEAVQAELPADIDAQQRMNLKR